MISDKKNRAMALLAIIISCSSMYLLCNVSGVGGAICRMIGL